MTIYCVSYTPYLVDISSTILFATSYYAIANIYSRIHLSALRGNPTFSDFVQIHDAGPFLLVGVHGGQGAKRRVHAMVGQMERHFGVRNVLHLDNLFDKGHMLQPATQDLSFVVIAIARGDFTAARTAAEEISLACGLTPHLVDVKAEGDPQDVRPIFKAILGVAINMA